MKKFCKAVLISCFLLTGCGAISDFRVNRQLDLGQQYLVDLEYDKAMLAYSKALQIEPKEMEAYKGLADVFTAQDEVDSSINVLKKGLAVAEDMSSSEKDADTNAAIRKMHTQIITQLTDMGDKAFKKEDYNTAVKYYKDLIVYDQEEEDSYLKLSGAYEAMGDLEQALKALNDADITARQLTEEIERLTIRYEIKKEYEELLARLSAMIQANAGELAKDVLLTQEFLDLVAKLEEPLIMRQASDQYTVVYPNGYVYLGQMTDQKRDGVGNYYTNNQARYVIYSGEWRGDKPNGTGRIDTVVYTNQSTRSPNYFGTGFFTNGISEGEFNFSVYYQNGNRYDYLFSNNSGIPPRLERKNGKNLVGYSTNDGSHYFLMSDSSIFAVPNFETEGYNSVFTNTLNTHGN